MSLYTLVACTGYCNNNRYTSLYYTSTPILFFYCNLGSFVKENILNQYVNYHVIFVVYTCEFKDFSLDKVYNENILIIDIKQKMLAAQECV